MHQVVIGTWELRIDIGALPVAYDWYVGNTRLAEEIDLKSKDGQVLFVAAFAWDDPTRDYWKPVLTCAQTYSPSQAGFDPGFLIVPETARLFVGAGTRILAYDLSAPARLWEDKTDCGFWHWGRHRGYVWMAAELEFAVWSATGTKLWSTFVEPPWDATMLGEDVLLDIMGRKERRRLSNGEIVS